MRADGREYRYENKEKGQLFIIRMQDDKPVCMNFLDSFGASGVLKSYMLRRLDGSKEGLGPIERVRMEKEGIPVSLIDLLMQI